MYKPEQIKIFYKINYNGCQTATLCFEEILDPHGRERKEVPRGLERCSGWRFWKFKPERLSDWLRRIEQSKLQMVEEWNALIEAEMGGDPDDPLVELKDIPEPILDETTLQALRDINAV